MDRDTHARLMYDAHKKSTLVAYLLWWFVGWLGIHRFYLGEIGSGILMLLLFVISLVLTLILIGYVGLAIWWLWWVVDAFLIPGMVTSYNVGLVEELDAR